MSIDFYVKPTVTIKKLDILEYFTKIDKDGKKILKMRVVNSGTVHFILRNFGLEYNTLNKKIGLLEIKSSDLLPKKSPINLLPKKPVDVWIPFPENIDPSINKFYYAYHNKEEE